MEKFPSNQLLILVILISAVIAMAGTYDKTTGSIVFVVGISLMIICIKEDEIKASEVVSND
jgi:hypothetical protein